ncbi:MAG: hypothetical protein RL154_784 [Pseudomonadota bacterium]
MNKTTHAQIKTLYLENKSVTEIASLLSVTRQTIYARKKADYKNGIDWDELALANARDLSGVKMSEKEFLNTLIRSFENALEGLDDLEPEKKLVLLKEYSTTYYKLKAPIKTDCKSQVLDAITTVIYKISEFALEQNNKEVINFLSANSDKIIEKVLAK